jgi:sulfate transport system permease protein
MTRDVIPGRPFAIAATAAIVGLVVVVPLAAIVWSAHAISPSRLAEIIFAPRTLAAFRLTFGAAAAASLVDVALGFALAWALTIGRFPGRAFLDALIDMPFALPTAVTGITLATLYGPHGWIGAFLLRHGIAVAFTPLGIGLALAFVGLPFVVRTVQPVLADIPAELAFARTLGEYGSVVFIAGNFPGRTEIVPLLVITHLEEYDQTGAAAIATVMLIVALALVLAINALQRRIARVRAVA